MKGTLVLCFIHGFKGGEDTFGPKYEFTQHLRALVAESLPKLRVRVMIYPKYETRGDLGECVSRFRDWLEEMVIDLEVAAGTPSPTVDASVRIILVGHSMGGIVAAETVMGIAAEKPIYTEDGIDKAGGGGAVGLELSGILFPRVQGVLAFDTPYLGISPGVVAHGAEGHYQTAQAALTQLGGLTTLWGERASSSSSTTTTTTTTTTATSRGAPPPTRTKEDSAGWGWAKVALAAGAAGVLAAGGATAWAKREQLGHGWTWVSSHLEFVGCLARPEALKQRVAGMVRVSDEMGVGFATLYTRLGRGAQTKYVSMVGTVLGEQRTFCNVPSKQPAGEWLEAVNDEASDETVAHMTMFDPKANPGYERLAQDAKALITRWVDREWYERSDWTTPSPERSRAGS